MHASCIIYMCIMATCIRIKNICIKHTYIIGWSRSVYICIMDTCIMYTYIKVKVCPCMINLLHHKYMHRTHVSGSMIIDVCIIHTCPRVKGPRYTHIMQLCIRLKNQESYIHASKDHASYIPHICHGHHGQCPWRKICHVEKFQCFIHDRCGEIWNFTTCGVISHF